MVRSTAGARTLQDAREANYEHGRCRNCGNAVEAQLVADWMSRRTGRCACLDSRFLEGSYKHGCTFLVAELEQKDYNYPHFARCCFQRYSPNLWLTTTSTLSKKAESSDRLREKPISLGRAKPQAAWSVAPPAGCRWNEG